MVRATPQTGPTPAVSPEPPAKILSPGREAIVADIRARREEIRKEPSNITEKEQAIVADIRARREEIRKDESNTTEEQARKNYVSWVAAVEQVNPEQITITGTYPKDACLKKLQGTTVYGVLVDTSGKVIDWNLIQSAGYPIFNEQAKKDIQSKGLSNQTGNSKPYRVDVKFGYNEETCPSLSVPKTTPQQDTAEESAPQNTAEGANVSQ